MRPNDPRNVLLHELTRAADGAGRIAVGAAQARHEVSSILEDPVGRRALNRLMITPETVRDHPELRRSFDAYITPDGHRSRIDLTQADRIYSAAAMDQVETLRRRTNEFLGDFEGLHVTARIVRGERRVGGHPGPDPIGPGPELVRRAGRCLLGPHPDPPRPTGLPQSGRHDGLDLRLRPGGDAFAIRHNPGRRGDRLEGAVFPVRPPGGRRRGLQRVPDGPPPRGVAPPGTQGGDHPRGRPDRRADHFGRGDHRVQLRVILVQPARAPSDSSASRSSSVSRSTH